MTSPENAPAHGSSPALKCMAGIAGAKLYGILLLFVLFVRTDLRDGDLGFVFQRYGQLREQRIPEIRSSFFERLAPFDGQWYQDISLRGYRKIERVETAQRDLAPGNYAFFPLLPGLLFASRAAFPGIEVPVTIAVIIVLSAVGAFVVWILARELGVSGAACVALLLSFPTAVYQYLLYTEGIFLLLSALALYFMLKGNLAGVAISAVLAGICRPQGVLLVIPLAYQLVVKPSNPEGSGASKRLVGAGVTACALSGFVAMAIVALDVTGSPLGFMGIQTNWGRSYDAGGFFDALESVFGYGGPPMDLFGVAFGIGLLPVIWKRLPTAFALYGTGMVLLPLLTGSILSMGRFMSVSIPHFLALGALLSSWRPALYATIAGFFVLQILVANGVVAWHFLG